MKKRIFAIIVTLALAIIPFYSVAADTVTTTSTGFTDVADTNPAKTAIDYCAENHFVLGRSATIFDPSATVTRGEFALIWARSLQVKKHQFKDATQTKSEMDNAIVILSGMGYLNGTSINAFTVNSNITREQAAAITKRTYYGIGEIGGTKYLEYEDGEEISSWAQDGVSFCKAEGIFDQIVENNELEPQESLTRAEVCQIVYEIMHRHEDRYTITIDPAIEGGAVISDKQTARSGQTVTLTITPETDKILVANSLKFNETSITPTGTTATFTMPAENVTITAEFADEPADPITLTSIEVTTEPTNLVYNVTDSLNLAGIVVTATFSDDSTRALAVTEYTATPANGAALNTAGTITVTISATIDGETKTDTFDVTVNAV